MTGFYKTFFRSHAGILFEKQFLLPRHGKNQQPPLPLPTVSGDTERDYPDRF